MKHYIKNRHYRCSYCDHMMSNRWSVWYCDKCYTKWFNKPGRAGGRQEWARWILEMAIIPDMKVFMEKEVISRL